MKRTFSALLLSLVFGSCSVFAACPTSTTPSANATNRITKVVAQLTKQFSLNTAEQTALTTYFTDVADNDAKAAPTVCADREALQTAIDGNAGSGAITAAASTLSAAEGNVAALNDTAESTAIAVLTEQGNLSSKQLTQLERFLGHGGFGGWGPRGGGGMRGHGPGGPPPSPTAAPSSL